MGSGPICETMQACMDIRTFHFLKCQCLLYKTVRAQLLRSTILINHFDLVARSRAQTVNLKTYNRAT